MLEEIKQERSKFQEIIQRLKREDPDLLKELIVFASNQLEAKEQVLGAEHPDTLTSVNNLAELLRIKGDYAEAQALLERALEASERILGEEDPDTLISVNNLAVLLLTKKDYAEALPLYERALVGLLKISRAAQAPHPYLEAAAENYAGCLEKLGRKPEEIRNTLEELGHRYGQDLSEVEW